MSPCRIQRRSTRGWRMPPGAVYVGWPTRWASPFTLDFVPSDHPNPQLWCRERYRLWLAGAGSGGYDGFHDDMDVGRSYVDRRDVVTHVDELRGHDLACWCPLDQPCHADVLLELASEGSSR
ncbi:DUF4326 domain-containing protein [Nocardiopsis gilva]|uniref:DUF4326 domain-containing protein n=1 Tax=Nocardiopsis gilva TaxID=280236 RepID=UPI000476B599|nr:DUF4326 domain-containing protein [Nocardiopsis gilva]